MGRRPKNSRPRRFAAGCIAPWCRRFSCPRLFMSKGSPWENGRVESFNRTLRDERLNRERFLSLAEARGVIDRWRRDYHHYRPHRSLNCQTPAATAAGGAAAGRPTASLRQHSASPPDSLSCATTTTGLCCYNHRGINTRAFILWLEGIGRRARMLRFQFFHWTLRPAPNYDTKNYDMKIVNCHQTNTCEPMSNMRGRSH